MISSLKYKCPPPRGLLLSVFGVPQGSILGLLLFTMYINDLPSHVNKNTFKICLYADDTAIFVRGQNVNEINRILNDELAKVSDWLNNNKLTLNVKKTKVMLFGSKIKLSRINDILDVKIKNSCVEQVNSFKYHGVYLDPSITCYMDCSFQHVTNTV